MTNWKWKKEVLGIKEGHHTARKIERVFYANDIHWVVSWERLNDDDGTSQITCWWCDHPPCHNHNHPLPYQLTESSCSITMNNSSNCSRKTLCGTIYIVPWTLPLYVDYTPYWNTLNRSWSWGIWGMPQALINMPSKTLMKNIFIHAM